MMFAKLARILFIWLKLKILLYVKMVMDLFILNAVSILLKMNWYLSPFKLRLFLTQDKNALSIRAFFIINNIFINLNIYPK